MGHSLASQRQDLEAGVPSAAAGQDERASAEMGCSCSRLRCPAGSIAFDGSGGRRRRRRSSSSDKERVVTVTSRQVRGRGRRALLFMPRVYVRECRLSSARSSLSRRGDGLTSRPPFSPPAGPTESARAPPWSMTPSETSYRLDPPPSPRRRTTVDGRASCRPYRLGRAQRARLGHPSSRLLLRYRSPL